LLSLLLLAAIVFVGGSAYRHWQAGPWDLPAAGKAKVTPPARNTDEEPAQLQVANTRNIVEKNLFDPERGLTRSKEKEGEASAAAMQRIRSMVLLGTAILGNSRYAIMQDPTDARAPAKTGVSAQTRLKLGDLIEGFKLSEIRDKSVVFTKGASRVELAIDYFRPSEPPPPTKAAPPPRQPVGPRIPPRAAGAGAPSDTAQQEGSTGARSALRGERPLQPPQQPVGRPPLRIPPAKAENAPAENP
jgi:hypothetical protein